MGHEMPTRRSFKRKPSPPNGHVSALFLLETQLVPGRDALRHPRENHGWNPGNTSSPGGYLFGFLGPDASPELRQGGQGGVLLREQRVPDRPGDAHLGVVPAQADLVGTVIEVRALVSHLRELAQDAEAVREPGRDEHLAEVVRRESGAGPLAEGGRAGADVHGHVEDLALQGSDQLALRPAELRVQAAQRAAERAGLVVLDERVRDPRLAVFALVEGLQDAHGGAVTFRSGRESPFEPVAVAADGEEVARLLGVALQLDAQRADEVVDRARGALVLRAPAAGQDVVAAQAPAA